MLGNKGCEFGPLAVFNLGHAIASAVYASHLQTRRALVGVARGLVNKMHGVVTRIDGENGMLSVHVADRSLTQSILVLV